MDQNLGQEIDLNSFYENQNMRAFSGKGHPEIQLHWEQLSFNVLILSE